MVADKTYSESQLPYDGDSVDISFINNPDCSPPTEDGRNRSEDCCHNDLDVFVVANICACGLEERNRNIPVPESVMV